jgi:hypothetical protein
MSVQVTFDYDAFIARYPEFATTVTKPLAEALFAEATVYHANDGSGPVATEDQQRVLLNMLVAHLAVQGGYGAGGASPFIGPITNASEGSVSVSSQPLTAAGTEAWFLTTKYGSNYWFATAQYRTMRYRPGPQRQFSPWPYWPYAGDV